MVTQIIHKMIFFENYIQFVNHLETKYFYIYISSALPGKKIVFSLPALSFTNCLKSNSHQQDMTKQIPHDIAAAQTYYCIILSQLGFVALKKTSKFNIQVCNFFPINAIVVLFLQQMFRSVLLHQFFTIRTSCYFHGDKPPSFSPYAKWKKILL